jgi:hypothetical protein
MTPDAITRLFKEAYAYDTFPPLEGKPTDDDLLAIRECILPLLMVIPYDQLEGIHSLTAILTNQSMAMPRLFVPSASPSTIKTSPMTPRQSSEFVRRRPTNPASMTTPVMKRPNVALQNFFATLLMRSGTMISKTPIPSTPRSRPSTSWPSLTPTAGGYMPST